MSCALGGHESDEASMIVHHEACRASRCRQRRSSPNRNVHGGHSGRSVGRGWRWILMAQQKSTKEDMSRTPRRYFLRLLQNRVHESLVEVLSERNSTIPMPT